MKAKLTWTNPTTRVDGTPLALSDIWQIVIFNHTLGGSNIVDPGTVEFTTTNNLAPGTYEWGVEVWASVGGIKSARAVVSLVVPQPDAPPSNADLNPVTNLTATLVP